MDVILIIDAYNEFILALFYTTYVMYDILCSSSELHDHVRSEFKVLL